MKGAINPFPANLLCFFIFIFLNQTISGNWALESPGLYLDSLKTVVIVNYSRKSCHFLKVGGRG